MRILLDNCVPTRLVEHLQGFEVETALSMEWDRKSDQELLELMNGKFDALITVDKKRVVLLSPQLIAFASFSSRGDFTIGDSAGKTCQERNILEIMLARTAI